MERSAELEAVTRRFFDAMRAGDDATVMSMWTAEEDSLYVGSDPNEWFDSRTQIDLVMRAQFAEMGGGFALRMDRIAAWTESTVGWSCADMTLEIDPPIPVRFNTVWHIELGQWRCVHGLTQVAVRNEEVLGIELTTSVDLVAQAV